MSPIYRFTYYAALSLLIIVANAAEPTAKIPLSSLKNYTLSIGTERVESYDFERWFLSGAIDIMMDPLDSHVALPPSASASIAFRLRSSPDYRVELLTFPTTAFNLPVNDQTLNTYLESIQASASEESSFEILEASNYSPTGAAKFRFLDRRAHQIKYRFTEVDVGSFTSAENWIERDELIHVVKVTAPSNSFDRYLENVRVLLLNSTENSVSN